MFTVFTICYNKCHKHSSFTRFIAYIIFNLTLVFLSYSNDCVWYRNQKFPSWIRLNLLHHQSTHTYHSLMEYEASHHHMQKKTKLFGTKLNLFYGHVLYIFCIWRKFVWRKNALTKNWPISCNIAMHIEFFWNDWAHMRQLSLILRFIYIYC